MTLNGNGRKNEKKSAGQTSTTVYFYLFLASKYTRPLFCSVSVKYNFKISHVCHVKENFMLLNGLTITSIER